MQKDSLNHARQMMHRKDSSSLAAHVFYFAPRRRHLLTGEGSRCTHSSTRPTHQHGSDAWHARWEKKTHRSLNLLDRAEGGREREKTDWIGLEQKRRFFSARVSYVTGNLENYLTSHKNTEREEKKNHHSRQLYGNPLCRRKLRSLKSPTVHHLQHMIL